MPTTTIASTSVGQTGALTTFRTYRKGPYPHFGILLRAAFAEIGHGCLIRWLCIHIKVFLRRYTYVYWFNKHHVTLRPTRCRKCIVYSKVPNQWLLCTAMADDSQISMRRARALEITREFNRCPASWCWAYVHIFMLKDTCVSDHAYFVRKTFFVFMSDA